VQNETFSLADSWSALALNQAKTGPKLFRQALREENFDWHKPNDRWTVELGSDHHTAMLGVLRTLSN